MSDGENILRKKNTFFPSGMALRSISTLACARTSADADMLRRKSVIEKCISQCLSSMRTESSRSAQRWRGFVPCTVALAPAAAKSPIPPTMKYWKVLFEISPLLLIYFAKLGILVVGFESPLNGLWKAGVSSYSPAVRSTISAFPLRCTARNAAGRVGSRCRGHRRSITHDLKVSGFIWTEKLCAALVHSRWKSDNLRIIIIIIIIRT